jgi:hypothetical protein
MNILDHTLIVKVCIRIYITIYFMFLIYKQTNHIFKDSFLIKYSMMEVLQLYEQCLKSYKFINLMIYT